MDKNCRKIIWGQFGAAIDTLENAIRYCPDKHWGDRSGCYQIWYLASHTLFWLDYYLSESHENFKPPEPFGLEELDPAGKLPERVYTREELLSYLEHGRQKARKVIAELTGDKSERIIKFGKVNLTFAELLLYNLRHVQHHSAQINMLMRQKTDSAPGWVFRAKNEWD